MYTSTTRLPQVNVTTVLVCNLLDLRCVKISCYLHKKPGMFQRLFPSPKVKVAMVLETSIYLIVVH